MNRDRVLYRLLLAFVVMAVLCAGALVVVATVEANPYMVRYEQAATSFWGAAPDCPAGVTYSWPEEDPFGENAIAWAVFNGCEMWLIFWPKLEGSVADRWDIYSMNCATVVHEWGHLLGHDHDPEGLDDWGDTDRRSVRHCEALATARYGDPDVLEPARPVRRKPRKLLPPHLLATDLQNGVTGMGARLGVAPHHLNPTLGPFDHLSRQAVHELEIRGV